MKITPEHITTLSENEIFVFGSNLGGKHDGGAAYQARSKFGAIQGQGVGLQGNSYAIPTKRMSVVEIKPYVDDFILFVKEHPELFFLITRIGCGHSGKKDEEIAPLFADALELDNVALPQSFIDVLSTKKK